MSLPIFKAFVITPGYFQMFDFHINFKIISKSSPHPERSRTLGETNVYVNMTAHLNVYVNIRRIYLNMYVNIRRSHLNVYVINIRRNSLNVYANMRRTNFFHQLGFPTGLSFWGSWVSLGGHGGNQKYSIPCRHRGLRNARAGSGPQAVASLKGVLLWDSYGNYSSNLQPKWIFRFEIIW